MLYSLLCFVILRIRKQWNPIILKSPSLKVKIPYWEGEFKSEIYDMQQNILFPGMLPALTPVDLITKGSQVASIIKNGGIWFAAGKFGTTWKLEQAVVQPRATLRGKCHIRLDESEMQTLESSVEKLVLSDEETPVQSTTVDDSDDDEPVLVETPVVNTEETQEPQETVETPKKKRVVKKKTDSN